MKDVSADGLEELPSELLSRSELLSCFVRTSVTLPTFPGLRGPLAASPTFSYPSASITCDPSLISVPPVPVRLNRYLPAEQS